MIKEIDIGKVITELKKKSEMGFVSLDDVKNVLNNYSEELKPKQKARY